MKGYLKVIGLDVDDFETKVSYEMNYALTDMVGVHETLSRLSEEGKLGLLIETNNMTIVN